MPISAINDYTESHWNEVKEVFIEAAKDAGFEASLVSDSKSNMIIQKSIVQNLYQYPIVICDVSAKNANVMFELGLRLSFGKPTIVVKDNETSYSFDTAPFRHIIYPKDMNYKLINEFKSELINTIKDTIDSEKEGRHESYLSAFAAIERVHIDSKTVTDTEFIISELKSIKGEILDFRNSQLDMPFRNREPEELYQSSIKNILLRQKQRGAGHHEITLAIKSSNPKILISEINSIMRNLKNTGEISSYNSKIVNDRTIILKFYSDAHMISNIIMGLKAVNTEIEVINEQPSF